MPGFAYRMSGGGASFRPARACPVMGGPHIAPLDKGEGALVVADVITADASVGVRVVLWRCQYCGVQLTGLGRSDTPVGDGSPGTGLDVQEFTWLEEAPVPLVTAAPGHPAADRAGMIEDTIREHTDGGGAGLAAAEIIRKIAAERENA